MAWTTPKTWADEELVTAALLNTHLRDNLIALKTPPSDSYVANEASDYAVTSSSFVDVDPTHFAFTFDTAGGDVLVHFHGSIQLNANASGTNVVFFDVAVDGVRTGGDDGILRLATPPNVSAWETLSFTRKISLAAGSHTFKLQWKVRYSEGAILFAGAGTILGDVHPQFWVQEVS